MRPAEEWFAMAGDDDGEGRGNAQMKGGSGECRSISASFHDLVGSVGGRLCGLFVGGGTSKLPGRMRSEQEDQHALPTATCTPKEPRQVIFLGYTVNVGWQKPICSCSTAGEGADSVIRLKIG